MQQTLRRHPYLVTGFVIACLITLFFVVRLLVSVIYWTSHINEPVQPWMTLGYIAHSWQVETVDLIAQVGIKVQKGRPTTLQELAQRQGVPVANVVAAVSDAVQQLTARPLHEGRE